MRDTENKMELYQMITSCLASSNSLNQIIIATNQENVLCNKPVMLELQSCNHDYDAYHAFQNGFRIITVNMDVVAITLYHFFSLHFNELCVEFGTGQHRKYIPIHEIACS